MTFFMERKKLQFEVTASFLYEQLMAKKSVHRLPASVNLLVHSMYWSAESSILSIASSPIVYSRYDAFIPTRTIKDCAKCPFLQAEMRASRQGTILLYSCRYFVLTELLQEH